MRDIGSAIDGGATEHAADTLRVIEGYLNDLLRLLEIDPARGRELLVKSVTSIRTTPLENLKWSRGQIGPRW